MENYAPQFKDKTMAELEGMREKCAKRIGVLADPVMLNIIEQEIAVRKAGRLTIWTLAWDTDNGTGASVHLTERDAYIDMIATTTDDKDQREEAIRIYDAEQEGSDVDFWEWFDENLRGDLDTFSIESHEIELPTATATPTESSTGPIQCFNDRELATVLYALREIQQIEGIADEMRESDHFAEDGLEPLTDEEIDDLCERLNLAPETPKRPIPQLSGAVGDFVRMAAAGNTDADDLQRLACDLLGLEHPKRQEIVINPLEVVNLADGVKH